MKLPQTSEYALRVMAQLVLMESQSSVRTKDLSEQTGIPPYFLSKILRRLVTEGLLTSRKGLGGGFRLARPAQEIRMIDVLLASGYRFETDHCVFGWNACSEDKPCPLHSSWSKMKEAFEKWAEKTTLADVRDGDDMNHIKL